MKLSLNETRVLGVLIEKAITTPDQYPLSLNGLITGCNQKSNRDPVLNLSETEVQDVVDDLMKKNLVSEMRVGNRVAKYQHRFCNTEFSEFKFNSQQVGVLCTLFLRGAQTPGELRTRSNRLCSFSDVQETEAVLNALADFPGGPFVARLAREPGRRESRYIHLFSGELSDYEESHHSGAQSYEGLGEATKVAKGNTGTSLGEVCSNTEERERFKKIEERVELLELTIEDLQAQVERLQGQLDSVLN